MTGIPDELVEKAARAMHILLDLNDRWDQMVGSDRASYREMVRPSLEAIGLPALLERVEAAEGEIARWHDAALLATAGESRAESDRATLVEQVAAVEALIALGDGVWLPKHSKIKRVQEDRRRDLGAIVTTSMVTVADLRAALTTDPIQQGETK